MNKLMQWAEFSNFGTALEHTPFVPFKMLLELSTKDKLLPDAERFDFKKLKETFPMIGLVYDFSYIETKLEKAAKYHQIP